MRYGAQCRKERVFISPVRSISISLSVFVFTVCKQAEFSKSCKLIGSERAVFFFTVLPVKPANDQTVVTALFPSLFLV